MIDPKVMTKFNRTEYELQELLLFCVVVAGKNAHQQATKLEEFLKGCFLPFPLILKSGIAGTHKRLVKCKMGQYKRIVKAFWQIVNAGLDLKTCTVQDLEKIAGIGPKTSRFFILHSRPDQKVAVLDTHILKWLREKGIKAPKSTPQNLNTYYKLEKKFLEFCSHKSSAELDLEIWNERHIRYKEKS